MSELIQNRIWASSRMLDLVQESFISSTMDRHEVLTIAALSLWCSVSDEVIRYLLRNNTALVQVSKHDPNLPAKL